MELKIEGDTFTLSGKSTPEEFGEAMAALAEHAANVTGNRASDGRPHLFAGRYQMFGSWHDGLFHLGINGPVGWIYSLLDDSAAAALQVLLRDKPSIAGEVGPIQ